MSAATHDHGSAYSRVLSRLAETTGLVPRGPDRQRMARCPVHQDRSPSLSVGLGDDGRVLLSCMAGCPLDKVLDALGLRAADLFEREPEPLPSRPPTSKIVAAYDYFDETGTLVMQVCRFEPKTFRQRRPDGLGGWIWRGVERAPLYRLPQVLRAVNECRVVWITEGEKDADALCGLPGIVATTNPGGAGKWRSQHTAVLVGADVRVVLDRDEPGCRHVEQVVTALLPVARSIEVVGSRVGKDASDHLAAGGTSYTFEVIDVAKPWRPPADLVGLFEEPGADS